MNGMRQECLTVVSQPPERAVLAHICKFLSEASSYCMCQRHAILGFVTGISKHDALVASADVHVILADVDTACDVGALLVDAHHDFASLVAETLTVDAGKIIDIGNEPDLLHHATNHGLIIDLGLSRDLAHDGNHVVRRRCINKVAIGNGQPRCYESWWR